MSDERTRTLERTWRRTGLSSDGLAYLLALERSGQAPESLAELRSQVLADPAQRSAYAAAQGDTVPGRFLRAQLAQLDEEAAVERRSAARQEAELLFEAHWRQLAHELCGLGQARRWRDDGDYRGGDQPLDPFWRRGPERFAWVLSGPDPDRGRPWQIEAGWPRALGPDPRQLQLEPSRGPGGVDDALGRVQAAGPGIRQLELRDPQDWELRYDDLGDEFACGLAELELSQLEELILPNCGLTSVGLRALLGREALPRLRALSLEGARGLNEGPGEDPGWRVLAERPRPALEELNLARTHSVNWRSVSSLLDHDCLPGLKTLVLSGNGLKSRHMPQLACRAESLENLVLGGDYALLDEIAGIEWPRLRGLSLTYSRLQHLALDVLAGSSLAVERLVLSCAEPEVEVGQLAALLSSPFARSLRQLELWTYGPTLSSRLFDVLAEATSLTNLNELRLPVRAQGVHEAESLRRFNTRASLPNLTTLYLRSTHSPAERDLLAEAWGSRLWIPNTDPDVRWSPPPGDA